MGVNLGDIFWDNEGIYGNDVNIAARLEGIADPGSILVSQSVFDQVKRLAQLTFENRGEQTLKNIAEPVQAYRVVGEPAPIGSPRSAIWTTMRPSARPSMNYWLATRNSPSETF